VNVLFAATPEMFGRFSTRKFESMSLSPKKFIKKSRAFPAYRFLLMTITRQLPVCVPAQRDKQRQQPQAQSVRFLHSYSCVFLNGFLRLFKFRSTAAMTSRKSHAPGNRQTKKAVFLRPALIREFHLIRW
jgi:hypothetical protein